MSLDVTLTYQIWTADRLTPQQAKCPTGLLMWDRLRQGARGNVEEKNAKPVHAIWRAYASLCSYYPLVTTSRWFSAKFKNLSSLIYWYEHL